MNVIRAPFDFELPPELDVREPPEARGLGRDDVRMMVAYRAEQRVVHARFHDLPGFLSPGDLLVINTSGTLPASLVASRSDGSGLELHLSTPMPSGSGGVELEATPPRPWPWIVEFRQVVDRRSLPFRSMRLGEQLHLAGGADAEILGPYPPDCGPDSTAPGEARLWVVALSLPGPLGPYLRRHGHPIQYAEVGAEWPFSFYQTVFALDPGSAEMPSAGRAFTPEMLTELIARGVEIAPVTLHTGVSSLEDHEPPYAEFYRVSPETARRVSQAKRSGSKVIAVGTTAVRALESAADDRGDVRASEGWTDLVVSPEAGVRAVDGLLTGWHEPKASHLLMLEAIAGRPLLELSYRAAIQNRYLWHEFGDLHLILPSSSPLAVRASS
jgi:S-adenosylmethionine:tRNA ribosyltransferase-isomerase